MKVVRIVVELLDALFPAVAEVEQFGADGEAFLVQRIAYEARAQV